MEQEQDAGAVAGDDCAGRAAKRPAYSVLSPQLLLVMPLEMYSQEG